MNKKYAISLIVFLLSIFTLFLPLTYYGFIDYIIENTIINININKDTLETEKAAVAIYNGAGLNFIPMWLLHALTIIGMVLLYVSIAIPTVGKKILTKQYWLTFRMKP